MSAAAVGHRADPSTRPRKIALHRENSRDDSLTVLPMGYQQSTVLSTAPGKAREFLSLSLLDGSYRPAVMDDSEGQWDVKITCSWSRDPAVPSSDGFWQLPRLASSMGHLEANKRHTVTASIGCRARNESRDVLYSMATTATLTIEHDREAPPPPAAAAPVTTQPRGASNQGAGDGAGAGSGAPKPAVVVGEKRPREEEKGPGFKTIGAGVPILGRLFREAAPAPAPRLTQLRKPVPLEDEKGDHMDDDDEEVIEVWSEDEQEFKAQVEEAVPSRKATPPVAKGPQLPPCTQLPPKPSPTKVDPKPSPVKADPVTVRKLVGSVHVIEDVPAVHEADDWQEGDDWGEDGSEGDEQDESEEEAPVQKRRRVMELLDLEAEEGEEEEEGDTDVTSGDGGSQEESEEEVMPAKAAKKVLKKAVPMEDTSSGESEEENSEMESGSDESGSHEGTQVTATTSSGGTFTSEEMETSSDDEEEEEEEGLDEGHPLPRDLFVSAFARLQAPTSAPSTPSTTQKAVALGKKALFLGAQVLGFVGALAMTEAVVTGLIQGIQA